ncbi:MAG TPA: hypothetical protein VFK80_04730 [Limnochordia bacterium]|nr:hypothetical protein [Limnochordia bacterium]
MGIKCRMVDTKKAPKEPGDMWFGEATRLSAQYERDWQGNRRPLFVMLPSGIATCVDWAYFGRFETPDRQGWTVSGEPPNITVHPSILINPDSPNGYHGWLRDGILSDDIDGRRY